MLLRLSCAALLPVAVWQRERSCAIEFWMRPRRATATSRLAARVCVVQLCDEPMRQLAALTPSLMLVTYTTLALAALRAFARARCIALHFWQARLSC